MNDEYVDVSIGCERGLIIVKLRGEMDAHTSPALQRTLDHLCDPRMRVTIDLAGVAFIDLSGLRVLLVQTSRFRESGGRLELINASAFAHRVIGYAGLSTLLHFADDRTLQAS